MITTLRPGDRVTLHDDAVVTIIDLPPFIDETTPIVIQYASRRRTVIHPDDIRDPRCSN